MVQLNFLLVDGLIRIRTLEAKKHTDPADPDPAIVILASQDYHVNCICRKSLDLYPEYVDLAFAMENESVHGRPNYFFGDLKGK
jgi:hypothetical protein